MGRAILFSSAHRAQMICERGMAQPVVVCASWTIPAQSPKTVCPSPQYTQPHRPPSILPNADRTCHRCHHIRLQPPAPADKATPWIRCPSSPSPGSCPQGEALDTAVAHKAKPWIATLATVRRCKMGSSRCSKRRTCTRITWQLRVWLLACPLVWLLPWPSVAGAVSAQGWP